MKILLSITSYSEEETMAIAGQMVHDYFRPGIPIILTGELGAGKTCFVKGIAQSLGILSELVVSPTFALINEYRGSTIALNHMDFYRLDSWRNAIDLGLEEYFTSDSLTIIEWGEKFIDSFPSPYFVVTLKVTGENQRHIKLFYRENNHGNNNPNHLGI